MPMLQLRELTTNIAFEPAADDDHDDNEDDDVDSYHVFNGLW